MTKGLIVCRRSRAGCGSACCPCRLFGVRPRAGAGAAVFRRSRHARRTAAQRRRRASCASLDDKVRIETPELADGFFLIDGAKPTAYFVRPAARVFMDARQSSRLTRLFVPVDPDDPCRQWQAMATARRRRGSGRLALRARRRGDDRWPRAPSLTGRSRPRAGSSSAGSIRRCKFPLRIKTEDGAVITAENIRDEPQPAGLFEIPPGFRKFDPEALIQQIKQSDVWVADEKETDPSHPQN